MQKLRKYFFTAIAMMLLLSTSSFATSKYGNTELLNMAAKQRMLSQRLAKNYFYIGKGINTNKATKQLKQSVSQFNKTQRALARSITNDDIANMIIFVDMSNDEFAEISTEVFSLDNGALILDLSETMLEGSQYIVDALKKSTKKQTASIVDLAGNQRMLSQRIAKYYISYQAGIKDKNSIVQMKDAVKEFTEANTKLMANKQNTAAINKELKKVQKLWKIVYKFYNNIEKGGLPVIVYKTTDDIMKKMDKITKMYVELYK